MRILVVGSGIFGATAALELCSRGCDVTLVDPGPIPHPLAESTDISKIVRCDYGSDLDYTRLGERALDGWRRWNGLWRTPRFHETGVTFLTAQPMQPGGFEHDSFTLLARRGHRIERLDAAAIATRFPAYRPNAFVDGYYHREGGWAESGAAVAQLVADAITAGVTVRASCAIDRLVDEGALAGDELLPADHVCVCTGAWVAQLVPELAGSIRPVGQPVFHLQPADASLFAASRFPVFGADISRTGYYGFPINRNGIVKIANHGTGTPLIPGRVTAGAHTGSSASESTRSHGLENPPDHDIPARQVTAAQEAALRSFLAATFPALADAPIVGRRLCVYGDTRDAHFWIARHPDRPNITVATGGSGHAFKFAPVLGEIIADTVLGRPNRLADKFRWRTDLTASWAGDAARSS